MTKVITLTLAAALIFSGCGTILRGSTKSFDVYGPSQSEVVKGVTLTTDPSTGDYWLPATLTLSRNQSYALIFSKQGYTDGIIHVRKGAQAGIIILDVVLTGLIGVVIDAATQNWNGLTPNQTWVYLQKIDANVPGPDKIRVGLSKQSPYNDNGGSTGGSKEWEY